MSEYSWVSPAMAGLQVQGGAAYRLAGGRIAHRLEVLQVAMGMTGFAFGGGTEHGRNVVVAFDVGLLSEIEIAAVGLRFRPRKPL
jgi:hypothetical protein